MNVFSIGVDHWQSVIVFLLVVTVFCGIIYKYLLPFFYRTIPSYNSDSHLNKSENRFRLAFDYASIGMAFLSLDGSFIRVNQSLCQMLGYSEKELLHIKLEKILHPTDYDVHKRFIQEMLSGKIKNYQSELRYFHKNSEVIWTLVHISIIKDHFNIYFIAQLQNVTAEKNVQKQLEHLAYHDPLTGLANRNKLEQQVNDVLAYSRRHRSGFALIFLDLDHFKNINDTVGHDAGDILLQIIAERLKSTVRSTDIVARIGGDEFVIVTTDINKVDPIVNIVQKILDNLLKPILIKGQEAYITTSIGISVYPYDGHDIQSLMRNADLALYRSKELGRNNYQFCTPEMTAKAREKMARQSALIQALAKNEFFLHYQPKLDITNWRISGVEALLRWNSKDYGVVTPDEIIRLAEEVGLIIPLSEWVLKTACKQAKIWQSMQIEPLTISVNLSAKQFKQAHFSENIMKILFENEFSPELLEVEITEGLIMHDPDYILRTLHTLKQNGIRIAIDDFGTGYSSLDYLKRLSIDKIKIDKTFIHRMSEDPSCAAIVTAMIAMANKLGVKTIAEGVESQEQFQFLLAEKCTEIQGYYLSAPLSTEDTQVFLQNPEAAVHLAQLAGKNMQGSRA